MDAVHLAVAFTPLAIYLLLLGVVNLGRRPVVTTGVKNAAALGLALVGFVAVGPMGLFVPDAAVFAFGPWLWLLLLAFYVLCVTLWILLARPRLVIFNATAEQVRPVLAEVVAKIDSDVRWAGDSLMLPQVGLQFHLEPYLPMRNLSLVAVGDRQSFTGWQRLERDLRAALKQVEVSRNPRGFSFLTMGLVLLSWPSYLMLRDTSAVARKLAEMLHM
jgi:hypothetical protein